MNKLTKLNDYKVFATRDGYSFLGWNLRSSMFEDEEYDITYKYSDANYHIYLNNSCIYPLLSHL